MKLKLKFKFLSFLVSLLVFSCGVISDKKASKKIDEDYFKLTSEFIKSINGNENFILDEKPFEYEYFDCVEQLISDSITFNDSERKYIESEIQKNKLQKWSNELVKNAKIISNDTIKKIFSERSKGWNYFKKNIGEDFSTYSAPIFLRDNKYCLFYFSKSCGSLCGRGMLMFYKFENGKWKSVKSYCTWIS